MDDFQTFWRICYLLIYNFTKLKQSLIDPKIIIEFDSILDNYYKINKQTNK